MIHAIAARGPALRPIYCLLEEGTLVGSSDAQLLKRFVAGREEVANPGAEVFKANTGA